MNTKLRILNHVVPKLISRGKPAFDYDQSTCMYRGPGNTKCAVGHLIPDDHYDPRIEHNPADDPIVQAALPDWAQPEIEFLHELQLCHDRPADDGLDNDEWLAEFKHNINNLARNHNLEYQV